MLGLINNTSEYFSKFEKLFIEEGVMIINGKENINIHVQLSIVILRKGFND